MNFASRKTKERNFLSEWRGKEKLTTSEKIGKGKKELIFNETEKELSLKK